MTITIRNANKADIAAVLSMQEDLASEGAIWGYGPDCAVCYKIPCKLTAIWIYFGYTFGTADFKEIRDGD